jgi:hypothetical protein
VTADDFSFLVKPVEHFLLLEKSHPSTLAVCVSVCPSVGVCVVTWVCDDSTCRSR